MLKAALFTTLSAASLLALVGCESHQARLDRLQKNYDQLAAQFHQDCSAEYLKVPPTISAKCTDEDKKVKLAWDQLQAERTTDRRVQIPDNMGKRRPKGIPAAVRIGKPACLNLGFPGSNHLRET